MNSEAGSIQYEFHQNIINDDPYGGLPNCFMITGNICPAPVAGGFLQHYLMYFCWNLLLTSLSRILHPMAIQLLDDTANNGAVNRCLGAL